MGALCHHAFYSVSVPPPLARNLCWDGAEILLRCQGGASISTAAPRMPQIPLELLVP